MSNLEKINKKMQISWAVECCVSCASTACVATERQAG